MSYGSAAIQCIMRVEQMRVLILLYFYLTYPFSAAAYQNSYFYRLLMDKTLLGVTTRDLWQPDYRNKVSLPPLATRD